MSAVVLTENIVLSRTRSHDLKDVRKLNCWNFELTDVSMVRRMPSVQVLSLSLNKIKTLADFAFCPELEELYLRKNEINDINEVFYLTNLSKLRKLWLADNPCADYANYRNTVLKALPDLEILDNIPVQDDEVRRADELGDDIYDPDEKPARVERAEVESVAESDDHVFTENEAEHEHSSSDFEQMNKVQNGTNNGQSRHAYVAHCESDYQPVILASNTAESSTIANKMAHTRLSYSQNDGDWIGNSNKDNTPRSAAHSMSHNSRASSVSASTPRHTNHSQTPALRSSGISEYGGSGSPQINNGQNRHSISNCNYDPYIASSYENSNLNGQSGLKFSNKPSFSSNTSLNSNNTNNGAQQQKMLLSKGGKYRNSNLLSAVLCLIKELDFASLEVVETALHCRMEELEE